MTVPARLATVPALGSLRAAALLASAALVVAFYVGRSLGFGPPAAAAWGVAAAVLALVAPSPALLVLAAVAPVHDWPLGAVPGGAKAVLLAALVVGVASRARPFVGRVWTVARGRTPAAAGGVALLAGVVLGLGTLLGLAHGWLRFGPAYLPGAAQLWVTGIGTLLAVLAVSAWAGWHGDRRPAAVAIIAASAALALSVLERTLPGSIGESPLGWVMAYGQAEGARERLAGIIEAPIAVATLTLLPLSVAGAALLQPDARVRLAAVVGLPLALLVALLALSRSALGAVALIAFAFVSTVSRRLAAVALLFAMLAIVALVPAFLETRVGPGAGPAPVEYVTPGDRHRVAAWAAAVRMGLEQPLTGHGFRAFERLHAAYGEPLLDAPHQEWLRLFAEEGVLVALVGVVCFAALVVALWQARRDWLALAALGTVLGYIVMASFNNPFNYAQLNIPVWLVVGVALGTSLRPGPPAARPGAPD